LFAEVPLKSGRDGKRPAVQIVNRDTFNLLTILKPIHQALQFAIRMTLDERLCGTGQAFG
jgi:hypothetical protein